MGGRTSTTSKDEAEEFNLYVVNIRRVQPSPTMSSPMELILPLVAGSILRIPR